MALRSVLLVLLLSAVRMAKGQYLDGFEKDGVYYRILEDDPTCVAVAPPSWYGGNEYDFGNLTLTNPVVHEYYEEYGMQHDEYTLVSIEGGAFYNCTSLTSIVIPNSVTTIGDWAFYECTNLVSIDIPNSVTFIGGEAFYNCTSLASIEIPNSLTSIEQGTFYGCSSLTGSLTIPNSVTTIGDYAFYDCSGFTGSLTIPNSVTTIGTQAFEGCSGFTGSLTIPNSVTMIDQAAFYGCSGFTGHLTIGNSVNEIGYGAFAGCSGLTSFNIPNSVRRIGGYAFSETGWYAQQPNRTVLYVDNWCLGYKGWGPTGSLLTLNEGTKAIADYAFEDCDFFTGNLTIPNSVITIGMEAFCRCRGFTGSLTIPNSMTEIGYATFAGCSGFSGSLVIPNSVTMIGPDAFNGCSGFTGSLIIPNSVISIGECAFKDCSGFTSITSLAETPPILQTYPNGSFYSWSSSTPVYVPCGFEGAYSSSQSWCRFFSNYHGLCGGTVAVAATPVDGGTVTGSGSFEAGEACTVTATANEGNFFAEWTQDGNRISTNSEYTFYVANDVELVAHFIEDDIIEFADDNLKAICVSLWDTDGDGELSYSEAASVKSLGNYFRNNSSLTSFDELQHFIGLSLIGDNAFSGCSGLTSIVLPKSITWIGGSAFNGCNGLTGRLTIPKSVTRIDYKAFYGCCNIDEIIMLNTVPPTLGTSVFCTTNPNFVIYVPSESLNDYKTANNWRNYEPYIKPMFEKNIGGYVSSIINDKWYLIAFPFAEDVAPTEVLNLLSEDDDYDLFQFDQSAEGEEWRNYKVDSFNLVNGHGYLYAKAVDVNLIVGGAFNEEETKVVNLDYDAGKTNAGWNLVGNPFPVDAYIDRTYYVMNSLGSVIFPIPFPASTPIPPCTGVFVKAEGEGETVIFTRAEP